MKADTKKILSDKIQLVQSSFHPSWIEVRQGEHVLREVEILFPLKKLPNQCFASVEEAASWLKSTERSMAKRQALRYLARQSLVSTMLYSKLQKKGYAADVCRDVIDECRQHGYLADDEQWVRIIERELDKGYGPRFIEWKWKAKGLPDGLVRKIATKEKQLTALRKVATKKRCSAQSLLRRGFDADLIKKSDGISPSLF